MRLAVKDRVRYGPNRWPPRDGERGAALWGRQRTVRPAAPPPSSWQGRQKGTNVLRPTSFAEGVCISPSVPQPIIPCQNFVDAVDGLGHSCLLSRCQSPQCRSRHERQVSSRGIDRGTPTRPLALSDDLVSPIVVRVCCCHRRASQEAPVFCRNPASAVRFTSAKKKKPRRASWMWEVYNRQKEAQRLSGGWASPPPRLSG
jgi:hypothetical protein